MAKISLFLLTHIQCLRVQGCYPKNLLTFSYIIGFFTLSHIINSVVTRSTIGMKMDGIRQNNPSDVFIFTFYFTEPSETRSRTGLAGWRKQTKTNGKNDNKSESNAKNENIVIWLTKKRINYGCDIIVYDLFFVLLYNLKRDIINGEKQDILTKIWKIEKWLEKNVYDISVPFSNLSKKKMKKTELSIRNKSVQKSGWNGTGYIGTVSSSTRPRWCFHSFIACLCTCWRTWQPSRPGQWPILVKRLLRGCGPHA